MGNAEVAASLPPLPEKRIVVGVGTISVDYLAAVAAYPKPDDKIRSTSLKSNIRLSASGICTVSGRLLVGTAEKIPPSELIDTSSVGDAFIGAVLYGM